MLNHRSLLKSGQILVHLKSSLPAFNCLLCLQDNSVNKLTCAIFSWPSFDHIPLLCFLERLPGLTWTEKNWTFILEALLASKKTARSFSTNFNMFLFKSLKASAPSASVEGLASQNRKKLFDICHLQRLASQLWLLLDYFIKGNL